MKVLGIIPARGGSKGILRKNCKLLGGKPLVAWTIEAALASCLDRIILSTEDQEIAAIATDLGAEVMLRPIELAEDDTPTLPVLQHVVKQIPEQFEAILTLQPTSPFRRAQHIDEAIRLFANHPDADSLVSVVKIPHQYSPESAMQIDNGAWLTHFLPKEKLLLQRQKKPIFWARNGAAIYLTRTERLADFVFGGKILAYEMGKLESLDLDDMEDWVIAEGIVKTMQNVR